MKKSWILIILFFFATSAYPATADKHWQKGKKALDKKEYSEAIYYFKKATEANPQGGDYYRWLGNAYLYAGQFQEAVDAFREAIRLPHNKDAEHESWSQLTGAYSQMGQLDSAISSCKKYIELKPDDSDGFIVLSGLYIRNKQLDEAITATKRAIELQPDYATAYHFLGHAYRMKKQYAESFAALKKAIEIEPATANFHDGMGDLFYENDNYKEATEAYKKAVDLSPNDTEYLWELADNFRLSGNYDEAIATISKAIELKNRSGLNKDTAHYFAMRSNAYRHKGNLEAALQDAEKAYSVDPANSWARYSQGAAYLDQGQYDESIKLLSQVESPGAKVLEATAYAKQEMMKEAEDIYSSIPEEELSRKSIPLMENRMALLQLFKPIVRERQIKARALEAEGRSEEALFELSEALKIADETEMQAIRESIFNMTRMNPSLSKMLPEDARECVLRAEMLVKESNFEKAAAEYVKAIRIAPYATQLYYNSALIYKELKKYPEAIRQMDFYLQAAPDAPNARAAKDEIIRWKFLMEKGK